MSHYEKMSCKSYERHLAFGSSVRLSAISRKSGASAIDIDRTGPQQTNHYGANMG